MSTSAFKAGVAMARPAAFAPPHAAVPGPAPPAGTFAGGTKIHVGTHKVVIDRYLSEGGFAHVYLVKLPQPIHGASVAVLKRVAVPDRDALASMRTEVETMKKLQGHRAIVTYIDSHASQLKGGGYEVFLLMEYCSGGGLIDFMNTRLQNRLTEPEVLKIFADVAEGVACMHYLKPPLLHRDLKVENVLISAAGGVRRYKLCDFGSTAPPRPAASSATECRLIEDDVQRHTTLQYRSPEMIDVYRKQAIDEKSDIWALGVLLYKLCYYTTPFEEQGQLAILNASFKFPAYPSFSDPLRKLIGSMLRENPQLRPNIYQVLREACTMLGVPVPVKDIYAGRPASESRRNQQLPSPPAGTATSPPVVGAVTAAPLLQQPVIPAIVPMRRGRPTDAARQPASSASRPSPSPLRGLGNDPFAALDSEPGTSSSSTAAQDELSARFPTLDQFTLLHDSGGKFDFDQTTSPVSPPQSKDITQRVTEKLADDAFVQPAATQPKVQPKPSSDLARNDPDAKRTIRARGSDMAQQPATTQPIPGRSTMVSHGTMTSPSPPPPRPSDAGPTLSPLTHFPSAPQPQHRSSSHPRPPKEDDARLGPTAFRQRPFLGNANRSKSQMTVFAPSPASSRPSLEGNRPSSADVNSLASRAKTANSRQRPSSVYLESDMDYLRDREASQPQASPRYGLSRSPRAPYEAERLGAALTGPSSADEQDDGKIASNVEFLRAMEDHDGTKRKEKRTSSGSKSGKRASMPSISLSSTKTLLAGRFGEAFRRFEGNSSGAPARTPSPQQDEGRQELSTIAGSEATGDRSDDGQAEDEEPLSPEMKRELERRRLAQEERRVEAATADYRKRLAERDHGGASGGASAGKGTPGQRLPTRATSIQNKVKTLLSENVKPSLATAGGAGYGRPADAERVTQAHTPDDQAARSSRQTLGRKPVAKPYEGNDQPQPDPGADGRSRWAPSDSSLGPAGNPRVTSRPNAPPKPNNLRGAGQHEGPQGSPPRPAAAQRGRPPPQAAAVDVPGDDYEQSFSARFPSLSGLELVETEIEKAVPMGVRSKEV